MSEIFVEKFHNSKISYFDIYILRFIYVIRLHYS